ncbi:MAG: DNA topoisomerase IB [Glutamicibacter sp.]
MARFQVFPGANDALQVADPPAGVNAPAPHSWDFPANTRSRAAIGDSVCVIARLRNYREASMAARRSKRLPITRRRAGTGFFYLEGARTVKDQHLLDRIRQLSIPPAWKQVQIAASARAKVQARGIDAAGRTQMIYHPDFRERQDAAKFDRLPAFGRALPNLRRQLLRDLRRGRNDKDRVTAAVVLLLDLHLLRIGTHAYSRANQSFGAASLRAKHLEVQGHCATLEFPGKSGQQQHVKIRSRRLARVLVQLRDQPGYELFRYLDDDGHSHLLQPAQINQYLEEHLGSGFTAKDFRTWGGSLAAFRALIEAPASAMAADDARNLRKLAIEQAAGKLGNTPEIAAGSYIDPRVLELADDPEKLAALRRSKRQLGTKNHLDPASRCLLRFLERAS